MADHPQFWLENDAGDRFYPARVLNRPTGELSYVVSNGGNTTADAIRLDTLEEVADHVVNQGFKVRARADDGGPASLLGINLRSKLTWKALPGFRF